MHELPISQSLLDLALKHADEAGGGRITDLYLVIGKLSTVVDKSIQFYWDIISEDTAAAGAELHFRNTPLKIECLECNIIFEPDDYSYTCESCGGNKVRVAGGEEFQLEAIDLESPDDSGTGRGSQ